MSKIFYKRNLAVPFFTQRDNTYIWQQKYEKDKIDSITGKKQKKKINPSVLNIQWHGGAVI